MLLLTLAIIMGIMVMVMVAISILHRSYFFGCDKFIIKQNNTNIYYALKTVGYLPVVCLVWKILFMYFMRENMKYFCYNESKTSVLGVFTAKINAPYYVIEKSNRNRYNVNYGSCCTIYLYIFFVYEGAETQ